MGNVDAVPLASQAKSAVQASRGDADAAWDTQRRFSQQCVGAAQVRSLVERCRGDVDAAAETQRRFLETTRRVLGRSEVPDAIPGMAQLKCRALTANGEAEAAESVRRNFSRRCPVVSQARGAYEAYVEHRPDDAMERHREFMQFAGATADKVPGLGHAKAWLHHARGEHERAEQALETANRHWSLGVQNLKTAWREISQPQSHTEHLVEEASVELAGPLTPAEIRRCTHSFKVTPEQCCSFAACPICMQEFTSSDVGTTLRCFHVFHAACTERWLQQSGNCPVCRVQVDAEASQRRGRSSSDAGGNSPA